MKTLNQFLMLMVFAVLSIGAVGCGKKDNNNAVAYPPNYSNGYYMQNGLCYGPGGTSQVAMTYCQNQGQYGNAGYYMQNGLCYGPGGTSQVAMTYCQNQGQYGGQYGNQYGGQYYGGQIGGQIGIGIGVGVGGGVPTQCVGQFYDIYGRAGYCDGFNCRGYQMYTIQGQPVICM